MSGTSCDGLDVVLIEVSAATGAFELIEFEGFTYPDSLMNRLKKLGDMEVETAGKLSRDWTLWTGRKIQDCIHKWVELGGSIDLVGFSGHTFYHDPGGKGTAAIGEVNQLFAMLDLPVVADYRSADVAAGGQGAPLVPLFDAHVFRDHAVCMNLGGIANATFLPASQDKAVRAWDICGCNLLLNRQSMRLDQPFDRGGLMASKGKVDATVLSKLNQWPHLHRLAPKSLAAEDLLFLHGLLDGIVRPEDACATAVEWMAMAMADAVKGHARPGKILVTGGGAFHQFLLQRWSGHLSEEWTLDVPSELWVEGKEAAAFGWLALRTAMGETTSLASVTGATEDVRGGLLLGNFATPDRVGT